MHLTPKGEGLGTQLLVEHLSSKLKDVGLPLSPEKKPEGQSVLLVVRARPGLSSFSPLTQKAENKDSHRFSG